MKILTAGERMGVRDFVGYVLWGKQHTLASKRMIAHNHRVTHLTGKQCYHRNDWVTYRAMEVDNFLFGKADEAIERDTVITEKDGLLYRSRDLRHGCHREV